MGLIDQLKLSEAQRTSQLSPVQRLRQRVMEALDRQIAAAIHDSGSGSRYARYEIKTTKNPETGETETTKVKRRFVKWYWEDADCKLHLSLRYGQVPIVLKGTKSTIDFEDYAELVDTMKKLRHAIAQGQLDAQLKKAADQRKRALGRHKEKAA